MPAESAKSLKRLVMGWQRFPSTFVLEGWLRPDHPRAVPAKLLQLLLAIYDRLFEENRRTAPGFAESATGTSAAELARMVDRDADEVAEQIACLQGHGLVVNEDGELHVQDPVDRSWPPSRFAMLPIRYAWGRMKFLELACAKGDGDLDSALALYLVLVAQRNTRTNEIWFSTGKSGELAGLTPDAAAKALSMLLKAKLVERPGLKSWVYKLKGLEPVEVGSNRRPI